MGGFFGAVSKEDCVFDLFYGIDYHSHLGTRRAGMAVYSKENGFDKSSNCGILNLTPQNAGKRPAGLK